MKTSYLAPQTEVYPVGGSTMLCASAGGDDPTPTVLNFGGGTTPTGIDID